MATYTQEQMQAIADEIEKQTDRGAAIVAAALLDNILENLIVARLIIQSPKRRKALFGQFAPLRSFSAKIELGFALGLFNNQRRESLELIREVRNKFAHRLEAAGFDHSEIAAVVEAKVPPDVRGWALSSRQKFIFVCNTLIVFLGMAAQFPQIQVKALDDEPAYHQYFDNLNAVLMHLILEKYPDRLGSPKPSSEGAKSTLSRLTDAQRLVMEHHLKKISEPISTPDDADCKRLYSDGSFELCKNQRGEYVLLPVGSPSQQT